MKVPILEGNAVTVRAKPRGGPDVTDAAAWRLLVIGPGDTASTEIAMTVDDGYAVAEFVPGAPGRWRWRVETTDPGQGAFEGYVDVRERAVPEPP